jgi:hypothetical protein
MLAYHAVKNADNPKSPYQLVRQANLIAQVMELKRRWRPNELISMAD